MKNVVRIIAIAVMLSMLIGSVALAAEFDLGGKTITVVAAVDKLEGLREEGRVAEAEQLFNCKLESLVLPVDTIVESMVTRLISGDSEYDVWGIDNDNFFALVGRDALLPINSVLPAEYFDEARKYAEPAIRHFSAGGNIYVVSSFETLPNGATSWLAFNKDILAAEGLPDPYDLYEAGEWNWDNFRNLLVGATKDFDGDGTMDQYGIQGMSVWAYIVCSNGTNLFVPGPDGKLKYNWNSPEVLEAIAFGGQLVNIDRVNSPSGGFDQGTVAFAYQATWQLDGLKTSGMNYGLIPFPKGPSADGHTMYTGFCGGLGLPRNSADPVAIAAVMDYLFLPQDFEAYLNERNWTQINDYCPDRRSAAIFAEFLPEFNKTGQILNYSLTADEVWNAYVAARDGQKTPAEAMNEVAAQGQAYLDALLGQ
ncbi:MAG: extracellular solute-binding protein [Firmicutes bacterium]|nr:extracellular solute-binding protein [Bacillota bacterium]